MRRVRRALLDVLFPSGVQCLLCSAASWGHTLCEDCRARLDDARLTGSTDGVIAAWRHEEQAAALVYRLKYDGIEMAAEVMAQAIAQCLPTLAQDTVITWVPASEKRKRERGVDHGRMLAAALSNQTGLAARQLLTRTGERHTQQGLDRARRLANAAGAFAALDGVPVHVLLVDDVLTTGATARECAAMLRAAGAQTVTIAAANRAKEASGGPSDL